MIAGHERRIDGRSEVFAPGLLEGLVALVTGGGTGLGRASALELARCGAQRDDRGRRAEVLEQAAAEIDAGWRRRGAIGWRATCARREDARRLVETVLERHGRLDLLVNNAGGQFFSPAELIAAKGWRAVWRLNVEGMLNMAEAAFELALERGGEGTVVNVTLSPHHGMPGMAHSGAARATVEALTRELAGRWPPAGVAVTAVAAGHFDTEVLAKYPASVRAGVALRCRCSGSARSPSTRGWSRCSPRRSGARSAARRSRSTARATTGAARGPRRASRTSRARCPRRSGGRYPLRAAVT